MALSQTSLDIDILTVATLYNRGSVLSSTQSYVPIVSSIGVFSKWINKPVLNIFDPVFGGYKNGDTLTSSINSIQRAHDTTSSSLHYNTDTVLAFSNANYQTLLSLSNIDISTVSTYSYIVNFNTVFASTIKSTINRSYSNIIPGVSTTLSSFYITLGNENASTLIQQGIYYYISRDEIGLYTYDAILNPNPLLGGDFGSNNPLPWFWRGPAPRFIGPGISSISSVFQNLNGIFYNNINTNFQTRLENISIGYYASNALLDPYRAAIVQTVENAPSYIDGGSSISTLYYNLNSTIISTVLGASTFGDSVSTISTFTTSTVLATTIPTLNGFSISQYISSADITFSNDISTLDTRLNQALSVPSVLINPFNVFSSIAVSTTTGQVALVNSINYLPGLYQISTIFQSSFIPFYAPINVSTNYLGYARLSTNETVIFSTLSTQIPYTVGSDLTYRLSIINTYISSLSTNILADSSTIYGTIWPYITGPGVSSLRQTLSTNTAVSYNDYSQTISSIMKPFSSGLFLVNSVPGLSSLYSTAFNYNSTIIGNISTMYRYVNTTYSNEVNRVQSTAFNIIKKININLSNYISAGQDAYAVQFSSFNANSSITNTTSSYIGVQTNEYSGNIYTYLSSFYTTASTALSLLIPFAGSTIYYEPLLIIPDYSTSLTYKDDTYIERSTTFYSISTNTLKVSMTSSYTVSTLGIQTSQGQPLNLYVRGGVSVQLPPPSGKDPKVIPSLNLSNFQIYNKEDDNTISTVQELTAFYSSITFNSGNLTMKRYYNRNPYGYVGINTSSPTYALDINVGDARKPSGITWLTASDARVKNAISTIDLQTIIKQISSLRLVSYVWSEEYRKSHGIPSNRVIGFLSQEVETVFPKSVSETDEHGFTDFKSLDVDQLYKAKYALTLDLLQRVSSLQMRVLALF